MLHLKHLWRRMVYNIQHKLGLHGTLKSEKALREKNAEIILLKQQLKQQQEFPKANIEKQRGYEQSAWNSEQSVYTDPALQARLQAQKLAIQEKKRKDDMKAFLRCNTTELPRLPGDVLRKFTTRKLDPDAPGLPNIPKSPHKHTLMIESEPHEEDTLHMPVMWML